MKVLLVTNDFPPRVGGIQVYLDNLYRGIARRHDVTVLAPAHPGDITHDNAAPFEVIRFPTRIYWPTASLERRVRQLAKRADVVTFGAVVPMNTLGPKLARPYVLHTHGFEVAWARVPGLVQTLRSIGRRAGCVTVVSEYTRRFIERATGRQTEMLKTGVDLDRYNPGVDGSEIRKRHGLGSRPVVACVSRLVARKGQDQIIRAMPGVLRDVPDAAALIVGGGPRRTSLQRLAARLGVGERVIFTGEVAPVELAAHYAAGDVFAMPCRSRFADLEVEGLGLVYLEAQACARPAIAGDSGGAPEAVIPGETGEVVSGTDHRALARTISALLGNPDRARRMGEAGRAFVEANHRWDDVADRFAVMLDAAAR